MTSTNLTGVERHFGRDEIIVTKTDRGGRITYANPVFLSISNLTEAEAIGAPHNLIRHPGMPRCVFKLLWDTVQSGNEIFAYVINRAANGDHYWVFAHVTPTFDGTGQVIGYHSNRRVPDRDVIEHTIKPIYADLVAIEHQHATKATGMSAALVKLNELLSGKGLDYERFIFSLQS